MCQVAKSNRCQQLHNIVFSPIEFPGALSIAQFCWREYGNCFQVKTIEKVSLNELMHLAMLTMHRLCRDGILVRQVSVLILIRFEIPTSVFR